MEGIVLGADAEASVSAFPELGDLLETLLQAQEQDDADEIIFRRDYEWSPYNSWESQDPLGGEAAEKERLALQLEREQMLSELCDDSPQSPEPFRRAPAEGEEGRAGEETSAADDFAKQAEHLRRMAKEAHHMFGSEEKAQREPATRNDDRNAEPHLWRVQKETNLGENTDRDQVPRDTPEQGASLEPLAEMLASMSLSAHEEGKTGEAEAMRQLEAQTRERQQQVEAAAAEADNAEQSELDADASTAATAAGMPLDCVPSDAPTADEEQAAIGLEGPEFFDLGEADPMQVVEALSQIYQSMSGIEVDSKPDGFDLEKILV